MREAKEQTGGDLAVQHADDLLAQIRDAEAEHRRIVENWDRAVRELESQYGEQAKKAKADIKALEKQLQKHAKAHKDLFFEYADRAEFDNGALIWSVSDRVKRAKAVTVERLKELGFTDGVKVEEKVWWDRLDEWPDERLIAAGTERVRDEKIEYEIKGGGCEPRD